MIRTVVVVALLAVVPLPQVSAQGSTRDVLQQRLENAAAAGRLDIAGVAVPDYAAIAAVYVQRGYAPLWTDASRRTRLLEALRGVAADGLRPQHYFLDALSRPAAATPAAAADADLLHTLALLHAAQQLSSGRVDPATLEERPLAASRLPMDARALLDGDPVVALRSVRPDDPGYSGLVQALARLRDTQRYGGWTAVPPQRLALGSEDAAVAALRRRLRQEGDLPTGADTLGFGFDSTLHHALLRYQRRHALAADGVLGPATRRELDVPLSARIDQVRINLERIRWLAPHLNTTFIGVNTAAATVQLLRNGILVTETRAIVGRPQTRTPQFTATLREIELNPTWTVPPGIVGEILAQIRRNPSYLRVQGIRVFDRSGRELDRGSIDYGGYSARTFPFVFRQDAGPLNPLGRIKFVLPNDHHVYLHDTPARQLFEQEQRTFSHGCIRVQNPVALAALVLDDPRWTETELQDAITTGATRRIPVARPLPVVVFYVTAQADACGDVYFHPDVYDRDAALLRALDRPGYPGKVPGR